MWLRKKLKQLVFRFRGEFTIDTLIDMGLKVGKNFNPQSGYNLDASHCWLINIGDNVTLAPRVQILAHDASTCHYLDHAKIGRVTIGNRVFIGAGSIVLPNITIGNDVIIGAGSVVTHSVPDGCVYAGNPARYICSTKEYIEKHRQKMDERPVYSARYTLRENISTVMKEEQYMALSDGIGYVE